MHDLWLATHNLDKVKEFKGLLKDMPFRLKDIYSLSEKYNPPEETGCSFLENAKIKFLSLKEKMPSSWILAEDSGIEVHFLNGRPGIHSSRYKGEHTSWNKRLEGLLDEMKQAPAHQRQAQMVSVIVLGNPNGKWISTQGIVKGSISHSIKGTQGFGYDFVFIPEGENRTMAELGYPYKNQHSHRFQSAAALKQLLNQKLNLF